MVIILVFALLGILAGYIYIDNHYQIETYRSQLGTIQGKLATLNKEAFDILKYKEEWDSLHYKISLTGQLRGKQIWWTPKLQALGELMPENIWITSVSARRMSPTYKKVSSSGAETPTPAQALTTLILEGFALPGDNRGLRSIENFARQLKENPTFSKVISDISLSTASRVESEELPSMSFRMLCTLIGEESR